MTGRYAARRIVCPRPLTPQLEMIVPRNLWLARDTTVIDGVVELALTT